MKEDQTQYLGNFSYSLIKFLKTCTIFLPRIYLFQEVPRLYFSKFLYLDDDDEHRRQVAQIMAENQDMLESFSTVSNELTTLQNKLGLISTSGVIKVSIL